MNRSLPLLFFALLSGAALFSAKDHAMGQGPLHSEPIPLPRDGDVAIREEFEAARRSGTREAYDLFIARHPQHALTTAARQERDRLTSK